MANVSKTRDELVADYLDLDHRYSVLVKDCSPDQLTWRPVDGSWSIADCIEHVALTNSLYLDAIGAALAGAAHSAESHGPHLSTNGWFSTFFLQNMGPELRKKFRAPGKIRPLNAEPTQALSKLLASHTEIRNLMTSPLTPDLNRIRFKNPFIPIIRFTVATALLVMAAHGRRHLLQAERVRACEGFPGSGLHQTA